MRGVLVAGLAVAAVGCGSGGAVEPAVSSSSAKVSTTSATPTTTSHLSGPLLPHWEPEIRTVSSRTSCQGVDAFQLACVSALERLANTTDHIAKAAVALGGDYAEVGLKAIEVGNAARKWVDECITEDPSTRSQRGCLQAIFTANNGDDAIVAEMYRAEQS